MENNMIASQRIKNRIIDDPEISILGLPKTTESRISKWYLHTRVHYSIIHGSQEVEVIQMSMNKWMDKENVAYTINGLLSSLKKEGNPVTCFYMDEPWGQYAVITRTLCNKPVIKKMGAYSTWNSAQCNVAA